MKYFPRDEAVEVDVCEPRVIENVLAPAVVGAESLNDGPAADDNQLILPDELEDSPQPAVRDRLLNAALTWERTLPDSPRATTVDARKEREKAAK